MSGTITTATELRQEAAALITKARECDLASGEGRAQAEAMLSDADGKVAQAKMIERAHNISTSLDAGEGVRLEDVDPEAGAVDQALSVAAAEPSYRAAFSDYLRRGPHMATESQVALETTMQSLITRGMLGSVDAEGGFLAPNELLREIDRVALPLEIIASRARLITTSAKAVDIVKGADASLFTWVGEDAAANQASPTFTRDTITAHGARVIVRVSNDLLEDEGFGVESYVAELAAEDKVFNTEAAFIGGSGTGQPWGIVTRLNGEGGTPNRVMTAGIGALTGDDLIGLSYAPALRFRRGSTYVLGTQAHRAARLLKDTSGAYIWQASMAAGAPDLINGYPVVETDDATINRAIAAGNDIGFFGNLKRYAIVRRRDVIVQRLVERYADTNEVGYLFRFREGGDTLTNAAFRTLRVRTS